MNDPVAEANPPFLKTDIPLTFLRLIIGLVMGVFMTSFAIFMAEIGWMIVAILWPVLLVLFLLNLLIGSVFHGVTSLFRKGPRQPDPLQRKPGEPRAKRNAFMFGLVVGASLILVTSVLPGNLFGAVP